MCGRALKSFVVGPFTMSFPVFLCSCFPYLGCGRSPQHECSRESVYLFFGERVHPVIVAAEDCPVGKPDPAIYRLTCERLNARRSPSETITPLECLVIEDSLAGIQSAKAAGMTVLAVATTYHLDKLSEADAAFQTLQGVTLETAISRLTRIGHESRSTDPGPR